MIGKGEDEVREARVLNRVIRVDEKGWEYEPDQRHAEMIVRDMNLNEAKGVKTQCEDEKAWLKEEDREEIRESEKREYRAIAV